MDSLDEPIVVSETGGARARKPQIKKNNWKREIAKQAKYKAKHLPKMPKCKHASPKTMFKCKLVRGADAISFAEGFYKSRSKIDQDSFILMYSKIQTPKCTNRRKHGTAKKFIVKHFIRMRKGNLIRICQNAFLGILNLTKLRVKGVCSRHFESGTAPVERRGGDRKLQKFMERKNKIINFVKRYKVLEIHYCRSRNSGRQYLPSSLSLNGMYREFNKENPGSDVKKSYFRYIFNNNFNIGFKSPSTDVCSSCLSYKEKIKIEKDLSKKNQIIIEFRVHRLRSKAFYDLAREDKSEMMTLSFDCQKNMILPKVSDQAAYYSRQIYLYNFGVVKGSTKAALTLENVFFYIWCETDRPKGSNEIASAIFHRLYNSSWLNVNYLRLICDGCGAQNKNYTMMGMLMYWLRVKAPTWLKKVELIFPIPGHSYIPPDRVFAFVEKKVKARETIINPEEYLDIYREEGSVIKLGTDQCPVKDWKKEISELVKPPGSWHFKFNMAKRFIITKSRSSSNILVRGESSYKSDLSVAKSGMKKNKSIGQMKPLILASGINLKTEKKKDVENLLKKHFGETWRIQDCLKFYKDHLFRASISKVTAIFLNELTCRNSELLSAITFVLLHVFN